ncbi:hypothetical protein WJX75_004637 [Coccomyxa subellipsoidea]|uniref:Uncharacterized protein n=1 Tax=Coccomyxa subellipsoidea TaxID=248742 RepID=A0ABR2YBU0_9CHLO
MLTSQKSLRSPASRPVLLPKRLPTYRSQHCASSRTASAVQCRAAGSLQRQREKAWQRVTCTYPEPETEKERSSVDFPQEWMTPQPSRRPDPMPEFEKLETPLPKKLPGDPEIPDEEEEEEEEKKKKDPEKDDPEKEKPDAPPGEE